MTVATATAPLYKFSVRTVEFDADGFYGVTTEEHYENYGDAYAALLGAESEMNWVLYRVKGAVDAFAILHPDTRKEIGMAAIRGI